MTDPKATLDLALRATNMALPVNGIDAWAANVDAQMAAAGVGARLLVMPEHAAEQWLSFSPGGLGPSE